MHKESNLTTIKHIKKKRKIDFLHCLAVLSPPLAWQRESSLLCLTFSFRSHKNYMQKPLKHRISPAQRTAQVAEDAQGGEEQSGKRGHWG